LKDRKISILRGVRKRLGRNKDERMNPGYECKKEPKVTTDLHSRGALDTWKKVENKI